MNENKIVWYNCTKFYGHVHGPNSDGFKVITKASVHELAYTFTQCEQVWVCKRSCVVL